jgi:hypothetical protein
VLLLPCPRLRLPLRDVEGRRKLFKHLAYVSPTIFRLIVEQGADTLEDYLGAKAGSRWAAVWVADEDLKLPEHKTFWQIDTTPHNTVDRLRGRRPTTRSGKCASPMVISYVLCQERHRVRQMG